MEVSESRISLGLCLVFLDKLLLADQSMPVASFEWTAITEEDSRQTKLSMSHASNMIIDA